MPNAAMLQIKKTWQMDKTTLLFQVVPTGRTSHRSQKYFLRLSMQPAQPAITLLAEKPEFTPAAHALNESLRKNIANGVIAEILTDEKEQRYTLQIFTRKDSELPQWQLHITNGKTQEFELIDVSTNTSVIRHTGQGTFTKRKPAETRHMGNEGALLKLLSSFAAEDQDGFSEDTPKRRNDSSKDFFISKLQRDVIQKLRRRIRTINKSLLKRQKNLFTEKDLEALNRTAKLLQTYSYLVKPGDFELLLNPEQTGLNESINLTLDPEKELGAQINDIFVLVKKRKKGMVFQAKQLQETSATLRRLNDALSRLESQSVTEHDLLLLLSQFGLQQEAGIRGTHHSEGATPYKTYRSEGLRILVGKGSSANDDLTKGAKSNDFWLHAVGQSGAHVLVDGSRFKDKQLPERVFRDAAILALHYSKARQNQSGEVYYTRKGKINKKKGMPPGLWNVGLAQSIFVRYDQDELKSTLDKLEI